MNYPTDFTSVGWWIPSTALSGERFSNLVEDGFPADHDDLSPTAIELGVEHVANIRSQRKRIPTNKKRCLRNKAVKPELKACVCKTRKAITAGDVETAQTVLWVATRKFDKAVSKGVIHKNQATNRKSKLTMQVIRLAEQQTD